MTSRGLAPRAELEIVRSIFNSSEIYSAQWIEALRSLATLVFGIGAGCIHSRGNNHIPGLRNDDVEEGVVLVAKAS